MRIDVIQGYNIHHLHRKTFTGVSTDSRTVRRGEIFFALRGESFDGHAFVKDVYARGAACVVVDMHSEARPPLDKPMLVVPDTTKAFGQLAAIYRRRFHIPFIAVAGSNGKTTTKEMIASVLRTKYSVLSTQGNLNNHLGVPQTLFRLRQDHEIAVIEIGTNHFGELKYLCGILQPTHGIITNIGREHMEYFKSLSGVAKAEGELFKGLSGVGYINLDDRYIRRESRTVKTAFSYRFSPGNADVKGKFVSIDANGCARFSVRRRSRKAFNVQLSVPGKHVMQNGLAAAAVGISHGIKARDIQRALGNFQAVGKRMEVVTVAGVKIINDTYNANPDSVISALETMRMMKCKGKKIAILADMLELGNVSKKEHQNIGRVISKKNISAVLTFGAMARHINARAKVDIKKHFSKKEQLIDFVQRIVTAGDVMLVKGSRGMKMEQVVQGLQNFLERKAA